MNNLFISSELDSTSEKSTQIESLKEKLEDLRTHIEDTQKYELLTTNRYLEQMELIFKILQDLSLIAIQEK